MAAIGGEELWSKFARHVVQEQSCRHLPSCEIKTTSGFSVWSINNIIKTRLEVILSVWNLAN
jgi:hypothetical protein